MQDRTREGPVIPSCRTATASVVRSDDARAREEEVAAVVGRPAARPKLVRHSEGGYARWVGEADELGHRVAHRLPAQPRTDVCAGGEEAGPLYAIRGARLYVNDSIARTPSKPRDAAARAHVVGLAREVAVGIDDDVVPCGGIVRTSPLSQPRDERAAGGRSRDLQIAIHLNVVAQIAAAFRGTVLAATVVKIVEAAACLAGNGEAEAHTLRAAGVYPGTEFPVAWRGELEPRQTPRGSHPLPCRCRRDKSRTLHQKAGYYIRRRVKTERPRGSVAHVRVYGP